MVFFIRVISFEIKPTELLVFGCEDSHRLGSHLLLVSCDCSCCVSWREWNDRRCVRAIGDGTSDRKRNLWELRSRFCLRCKITDIGPTRFSPGIDTLPSFIVRKSVKVSRLERSLGFQPVGSWVLPLSVWATSLYYFNISVRDTRLQSWTIRMFTHIVAFFYGRAQW